ncbi:MAG: hypothetical protein IJD25_00845, partial [Alphaproteobacteria bacterium]|nr:hypothetical protein [Alphaproteobacteria bacterium]
AHDIKSFQKQKIIYQQLKKTARKTLLIKKITNSACFLFTFLLLYNLEFLPKGDLCKNYSHPKRVLC